MLCSTVHVHRTGTVSQGSQVDPHRIWIVHICTSICQTILLQKKEDFQCTKNSLCHVKNYTSLAISKLNRVHFTEFAANLKNILKVQYLNEMAFGESFMRLSLYR